MDNKKIRAIGAGALVFVWLGLTAFSWFGPKKEFSDAERRPLAQAPTISGETVLNGKFMSEFEKYALDQFPGRDSLRQLKSLFHYYGLWQQDNNDIYMTDGYAVKQEYPLDPGSVDHAVERFNHVYEKYLKDTGSKAWFVPVPDKGYYLAEQSGHLALDYSAMIAQLETGIPWASFIDVTDSLSAKSYYRTDTHWRQEYLLPAAEKISLALGVTPPKPTDFNTVTLDRPFYGVYYGQAALPMAGERLSILESPLLNDCTVFNFETGKTTTVYDHEKAAGKDMYDIFLSGSYPLLTIENPNATTDKELIVFRDSFGSSIVPLLVQDYKTVTLVDIRYVMSDMLGSFLDFHGQDVLFLYSTLVLNNSQIIK